METSCRVLLLVVAAVGTWAHHNHGHHHDHTHAQSPELEKQPVVESPSGQFRGGYNVTRLGRRFETYRGIRYAEPPVGELRFQPPRLILEYKVPVDASKDGPACPHPVPPGYPLDEDCLIINVYTPLKKERKEPLPVIFYIHAGGYYSMTGRSDLAGPHYLLDKDIVLVTINYRLGSLGFLSTGDSLAPGNNGLKDQVAALRWVQRNIAAFGGDPGSVTIAGCSVGSFSVMLHMISPMSKGLFHRAISMSGSPIPIGPTPHHQYQLAVRQAELLHCPTTNSKAIVDCLKTKPWKELGDSLDGFSEFAYDPVIVWMSVVEDDFGQERFLTMDPVDAIRQRKMHPVPYIVSQTTDEFSSKAYYILENQTLIDKMNAEWESVAPIAFGLPRDNATHATHQLRRAYLKDKPLKNDSASATALGLLYQDSIESFPVNRMVKLMSRHSSQPVWYYEFAYIGNHSHYEDPVTNKPVGAVHHDDLIYLFTLNYRFPDIGRAGADALMVERMTGLWYTFAKYGDPNRGDVLKGLNWPRVLPDEGKYLRLDSHLSINHHLKEERMTVWEQLYPITY